MRTRLVNTAADVILRALTQNRTAAGIAVALESAQLLQSPETAAEREQLRDRVTELEALTAQATEFRLWEPGYGLYVRRAPGTTGYAVMEARRTDKGRRVWTTAGWQYSALLSDAEMFCWPDAQMAVAEAQRVMPGATVPDDDVTPQVQKLRAILAGQREQATADGPPHHTYRLGRDLPETDGAR